MAGTKATICCDTAVEVGCGLAGEGTAGDPITAAPAAGEQAWSWTCPDTDATLHCDPTTGQLWTPPEHDARARHAPTFTFGGAGTFGPTGGPVNIGAWASIVSSVPPQAPCRAWTAVAGWTITVDLSYGSDAEFLLGVEWQPDGGPDEFIMLTGVLDTGAVARREWFCFDWQRTIPQHGPADSSDDQVSVAVDVLAGSIVVHGGAMERWNVELTRGAAV